MQLTWTLILTVGAGAIAAQSKPQVNDLAFLAGCWSFERNGRIVEEHWLAPSGGTLVGVSRTVAGAKTVEYEFLQIRDTPDGLAYIAKPFNQPEATFIARSSAAGMITFENRTHDFPQRIRYHRDGDTLMARIEGTVNGTPRVVEFPYRRASCSP